MNFGCSTKARSTVQKKAEKSLLIYVPKPNCEDTIHKRNNPKKVIITNHARGRSWKFYCHVRALDP